MSISQVARPFANAGNDRRVFSLATDKPGRAYAQSLVINCPHGCNDQLGKLLAGLIVDGVRHVHLAGPEGGNIKLLIEAILARGGFMVPLSIAWYEGESLDAVVAFASSYCRQRAGGTQVVHL
jgi:hypothetical protein